ncbi:hypothetical protein DPEC_G00343350 [Dallia pectoralis]|uniref:Uncharacterized protein n=1 Tax=Dallia pectoralis TaxID=75939 RepID=A0ACC2F2U9_DALPE|nr:hypothetical protein DPEC_G00343350 [Dallia pectoralis]
MVPVQLGELCLCHQTSGGLRRSSCCIETRGLWRQYPAGPSVPACRSQSREPCHNRAPMPISSPLPPVPADGQKELVAMEGKENQISHRVLVWFLIHAWTSFSTHTKRSF